jgi:hypothetical protein
VFALHGNPLLFVGGVFLLASLAADVSGSEDVLLEDGTKLIGAPCWLGYSFEISLSAPLRVARGGPEDAAET